MWHALSSVAAAQEPGATPSAVQGPFAGTLESWAALQDALLAESLHGVSASQIQRYEQLAQAMSVDDPNRSDALLHLGRACAIAGDLESARRALRECVRLGPLRDTCRDEVERLEMQASAVRSVPIKWTFDADHGLIHPWRYDAQGAVRTESLDDDPALEWSTFVGPQSDDQLRIALDDPSPPPKGLRFEARADAFEAHLRVIAIDDELVRYTLGHVVVQVGQTQEIDVPLGDLVPVDPDMPPLDPARLVVLVIQDATSYSSRSRGRNTIWLDDVEVY